VVAIIGNPEQSACGSGEKLVNKVSDPDPKAFLLCPNGTPVFGVMPVEPTQGWNGEPIQLQYGYPGPRGYGYLHVQSNEPRIKQLKNLGFSNFEAFAHLVASNYSHIIDCEQPGRVSLVYDVPGYSFILPVQMVPDKTYWTIITGLPTRRKKETPLWVRREANKCETLSPTPEPRRRFPTLSLPNKSGTQEQ